MTRSALMDFTVRSLYSMILQSLGSVSMAQMNCQIDFDKFRQSISYTHELGQTVNPSSWDFAPSLARRPPEYQGKSLYFILFFIFVFLVILHVFLFFLLPFPPVRLPFRFRVPPSFEGSTAFPFFLIWSYVLLPSNIS